MDPNEINAPNSETKEEFDGKQDPEKNQDGDGTPENKGSEDGSPSEKKEGKDNQEKDGKDKDDKGDDLDDKIPDYRPKPEDKKPELSSAEKKIVHLNKENKELKAKIEELNKGNNSKINEKELEDLASELGVSVEAVKKMQKVFSSGKDTSAVEEKIDSLISSQRQAENEKNFSADFDRWAKDNPERLRLKEFYKKIAFDPDHINLKNFDEMEKHFFPKPAKTKKTEAGTAGVKINGDTIDFKKLTPEQEKKVMEDPATRKKYFDWLDAQES
ncbi:MAG TPA: hypothetical protein PKZ42_01765 [Syntrophales bacterium]|nr:hypothetical protein [Syntrophales bacterium]